jgi:hypothetical protein
LMGAFDWVSSSANTKGNRKHFGMEGGEKKGKGSV